MDLEPEAPPLSASNPTHASIPFKYISDTRQRIEAYRKLAQASDQAAVDALEKELRDRFGAVPPGVRLLLGVGQIRILAAERGITSVEVKADKLMLTRNGDLVMTGSKFPRLTATTAAARLEEIKGLLRVL